MKPHTLLAIGLLLMVRPQLLAQETKERITLKGHTDFVYCVAFSPDRETLASGSRDGTIILWDVRTGKAERTLRAHKGGAYTQVLSVAFAPDGKTLASGSWDETVKLWDAQTGELKRTLEHGALVYRVAFAPDGKAVASAAHDRLVRLWDVQTGEVQKT
jgi:WD40 repeat protein